MRTSVVAVALAGGLTLAAALGGGEATVDGQVLFVPTTQPILGGVAGAGPLQILRCDPSVDGLRVTGAVAGVAPVITVMVSADDPIAAGVRVGRAFASQIRLSDASAVGDFQVTLPWADKESLFALAMGPDPSEGPSIEVAAVGCPGTE